MPEPLLTHFMQPLLAGRRRDCFHLIHDALRNGYDARHLLCEVLWPAMGQLERLYDADRINTATANMAVRISRTLADQLQAHLPEAPVSGRRALITCADHLREELGAQMIADLLQADGWEVYFLGGGVPHDEVVQAIGQVSPALTVMFGARPEDVPGIRALIERIREIGICPTMNIVVSAGVFNRAEGLWEEVGADAWARDAREVLALAGELEPRRPSTAPRVGLVKKRRRRRKTTPGASLATASSTP